MKKRFISLLLTIFLALMLILPVFASGSLSNFERLRVYSGAFDDVSADAWYHEYVRNVYEHAIMNGRGADRFAPMDRVTLAETIRLAAVVHSRFRTGSANFAVRRPWYEPYVYYALRHGILEAPRSNYNAIVTRADFVQILSRALPDEAVTPINRVGYGAIPDVSVQYSFGQAVYRFYRAGILTGRGEYAAFYPNRTLTRAEAAAIISRMIDGDSRVSFQLLAELSAEEIYKMSSPAVFYIEVFDRHGELQRTGSGFFICETGIAVTNHHVITGAAEATIATNCGEVHEIIGIYDYDRDRDLALIQVDGGPFPYLRLADSDKLLTGATVFALGSPLGLQSTFSRGIVSNARRVLEDDTFIQTDAPMSHGSSGGALIDSFGFVVGVTTASARGAQNINLAVPINKINDLCREEYVSLISILPMDIEFYALLYPVPDFGAFAGVRSVAEDVRFGGLAISYAMQDLPYGDELTELIDEYMALLEQNFFTDEGHVMLGDVRFRVFYNSYHDMTVMFGFEESDDANLFTIVIIPNW